MALSDAAYGKDADRSKERPSFMIVEIYLDSLECIIRHASIIPGLKELLELRAVVVVKLLFGISQPVVAQVNNRS